MLQRDHGDIEIVDIDGKNIYVNLKGACQGCRWKQATLGGIQHKLVEALGERACCPASRNGARAPRSPDA
jgi:NifU-like protein